MGEDVVVDGFGEVEANHVGVFDGAENRPAEAGAVADAFVDGGGVSDAFVDDGEGFTLESVLEAVGDEAGDVFVDFDGVLTDPFEEIVGGRNVRFLRILRLYDLNQRHQIRRVPKVGANNPLAPLRLGCNFSDAHH